MKPVAEWDENYLNELISIGEQESLSLDYKASAALAKNDKEKNDLSKDVSAFANSAGGILVYGMLEDRHIPTAIDVGLDRNQITKEWLESSIKSRIQPSVDDVVIRQIELPSKGRDKVAYAVQVGAATSRAPHQAFDHRYYKRFNFESAPMEDYEVRDLMRRSLDYGKKYAAAWDLVVEIQRLRRSAIERVGLGNHFMPRTRLAIGVSQDLRTAGSALVLLTKPLRQKVSNLVMAVDEFNSIVETIDPGNHELARISDRPRAKLNEIMTVGDSILDALDSILDREP